MASSGEEKEEQQEDNGIDSTEEVVLDLSGRRLKRLEKAPANQAYATALVLDNNQLQNLVNLDSYGELERLSIANNQLVRMYWFARMYSLRILNLPNNNIVQIEGLRELAHLVHLNLAGNHIKSIEGLSYNTKLEHLNLSGNYLSHINDLSMLKSLKELFLHRNRLNSLFRCNKYLPASLIILTLSDNSLVDLNDLSNLSHLHQLEQLTILNNPCLEPLQQTDASGVPIGPPVGFDYRPYVINWCLNLKVLDGYKVTPKESLKGEWLYSQGKGRGFQVGEHTALVQYLSGVCLAGGGWGGAELPDDDEKLAKILQLAKQHQHDLRHSSVNGHENSESSSGRGSRASSHKDSPAARRRSVSRSASLRRNTAPTRSTSSREAHSHRRTHSHTTTSSSAASTSACALSSHHTSQSYHVELSSTLYGGDLRTPDTPGLMSHSMDPALLAQLAGGPSTSIKAQEPMSRSLGADQMAQTLGRHLDPMMQSMGPQEMAQSLEYDPMTQSMGPEQMAQTLAQDSVCLMTRSLDLGHLTNGVASDAWGDRVSSGHPLHQRPTSLFGDENELVMEDVGPQESSQLLGSSKFVPAPESIMSPEFQVQAKGASAISVSRQAPAPAPATATAPAPAPQPPKPSQQQCPGTPRSSSLSRAQRSNNLPPPSSRPTSAPQASPRVSSRPSSVTRPRTSPMKSPAPSDVTRGSPSRSPRPHGTNISATLPRPRQSPRPAPRYGRSMSTEPGKSSPSRKAKHSGSHRHSDESDNTDSEMSVSKLHSIKSIAAERKHQTEKRHGDTCQYDTEHYTSQHVSSKSRHSSNSSAGSSGWSMNEVQAAITLQKHWRGYQARNNDTKVSKIRDDIRHSRAEQHIKLLSDKLRATEEALAREKKLRHMQLDAIRALWREIQKLQAGKKEGVNTPSTPMTPLTPLTPLEVEAGVGKKTDVHTAKKYSEESVKQLVGTCTVLQDQVTRLEDSLAMVTNVMNAFCQLPGSQSLLTMSQSSGSGQEKSPGGEGSSPPCSLVSTSVPLSESVSTLTHSIRALTSSIVKSPSCKQDGVEASSPNGSDGTPVNAGEMLGVVQDTQNQMQAPAADMAASVTSIASADLNSTALDVSTLSVDSGEGADVDVTGREEAELSESSQSSLSGSLSGSHSGNQSTSGHQGPPRPSSLPVPRPHTPRTSVS